MKHLRHGETDHLKEKDDVPEESKDDGRVPISNVSCINADQLHLRPPQSTMAEDMKAGFTFSPTE